MATKVVVGILVSEQDEEVTYLEKWFNQDVDVRRDLLIRRQMLEFITQHAVQRVALVDGIIGCTHEEGIDYPEGENCPKCPYWANRDRWTGEIIQKK